jgi:hypothetical protein
MYFWLGVCQSASVNLAASFKQIFLALMQVEMKMNQNVVPCIRIFWS